MKYLFTLLILVSSLAAFAQTAKPKSDTTKVEMDTIRLDLVKYGAYQRLMNVELQRRDIQGEAKALQERNKSLDKEWNSILESEINHDERFKGRELAAQPQVIGTQLVVPVKKLKVPTVTEKKKPK